MTGFENPDGPMKVPLDAGNNSWLHRLVIYAAKNPYEFCWYLLLALSPLFFISAYLSWKLAKAIDAQEKRLKGAGFSCNDFEQLDKMKINSEVVVKRKTKIKNFDPEVSSDRQRILDSESPDSSDL